MRRRLSIGGKTSSNSNGRCEGTSVRRPGYFDYGRDGFGPVVADAQALKQQLLALVADGCRPPEPYRQRMAAAMPDRDGLACQRCFDSIVDLG